MPNPPSDYVNLGTRIGRGQAFGAIALKCSAAQAKSLLEVWESGSYKLLDLTWDEYCPKYLGLSRQRVDGIIRNLREFGDVYCRLREIVGISPESFRQIESKIQDEKIEISGEMVPIIPDNAARIREAILGLRADLRKAREEAQHAAPDRDPSPSLDVAALQSRLDACFARIRRARSRLSPGADDASLRGLIQHALDRLQELAHEFESAN